MISSRVTPATKFLSPTDTQTDIFKKQSNHVQDIPKRLNPVKNQKSKIFTKPILSSIYIEESKNSDL